MSEQIIKKYYTIGEVSAMIGESPSLIRFWEKEFSALKPDKTEKGTRKYTDKEIQLLRLIHHLVKDKGYTLQGAADFLKHLSSQRQEQSNIDDTARMISSLTHIKVFLETIRKQLDLS